jgi:hypothetical protein
MRFRNFIPLAFLLLFTSPLGLAFLFFWEGHAFVICGMQIFHALILVLVYRGGIHSVKKNFQAELELGKIIYLPLKVNLAFYFFVGVPIVMIFSTNIVVLMAGYAASLVGFSLAYISGLTYVVRSAPSA